MDELKKTIKEANEKIVKSELDKVLKDLNLGDIEILSLKIKHVDGHAHQTPCLPPKTRVCYWDLYTGKRICKCV